uniref:Uncharacterized protein n=1 Tax=Panagrolaimus sp. PS1159 TaxID=55785 RepID=A0AC35GE34_9BILA
MKRKRKNDMRRAAALKQKLNGGIKEEKPKVEEHKTKQPSKKQPNGQEPKQPQKKQQPKIVEQDPPKVLPGLKRKLPVNSSEKNGDSKQLKKKIAKKA